jgi:hypothetical protein
MESITTMIMTMIMKKMMMITIGIWVMMTMCTVLPIKEGDSLLQAYYLEVIIAGKLFDLKIVSIL